LSYLRFRFHVPRGQADELSAALDDVGALSVTWEDAGDQPYLEVACPQEPDWAYVGVTGLFQTPCQPEEVTRSVNERLGARLVPEVKPLEERDWERAWLEQFQPRRYRGDLWVCPSWAEPPDPPATSIVLDPGLAFGTGDHATTAMCLDWIGTYPPESRRVMDYGCGSGILAIACLLKGAVRAVGVDVDERALSASRLNAERNGVAERYTATAPDEQRPEQFDLVVANILSKVLLELRDELTAAVVPGGTLLLTGILEEHAARVSGSFAPDFRFTEERRDGWSLLRGTRM